MRAVSQNPATEEILAEHEFEDVGAAKEKVFQMRESYNLFRRASVAERCDILMRVRDILARRKFELAELITKEMGKPISQAVAEIEKCKVACEYYAQNAERFLRPEKVIVEPGVETYVEFDPIGVVLAIMPWNFPFWQVMRCVVPTILVGNTVVLKHAPNTFLCAKEIERIFREASPYPIIKNVFIVEESVEEILDLVDGVSLTGSTRAGMAVGELAGRGIKPMVLELGGSDPFIVFDDADLDRAVESAVRSRMINSGQSCIAAKRFLIHEKIYHEFSKRVEEKVRRMRIGDPMSDPDIGPLAKREILENALRIVRESASGGAKVIGGRRLGDIGFFFEPAVIHDADVRSPAFLEETFSPIMPLVRFRTEEEAIELANGTQYGLGATVFTGRVERAKEIARFIDAGCVFVNQIVRSHHALPFGGVKKSGVGRELSRYGVLEFANIKVVSIKE